MTDEHVAGPGFGWGQPPAWGEEHGMDELIVYRGNDPLMSQTIPPRYDFTWGALPAGREPLDGVTRIDLRRHPDPDQVSVSRSDLLLLVRWAEEQGAERWLSLDGGEHVAAALTRLSEQVSDG
jgi:hypothetical protein